jgi:hypothetical protein
MMWPVTSLLAHLWHPKRANERQLPTNTVGRRARLDEALEQLQQFDSGATRLLRVRE